MLLRLLKVLGRTPAASAAAASSHGGNAPTGEAATHYSAGRYAEARPLYEKMHKLNPNDAEILFRLGVIYATAGQFEQAQEMLERSDRLQPRSVDVMNAQANVAWLQSAWPRAGQCFEAAIKIAPANATLLANYGLFLHDAGRFDMAADRLKRALELDPLHVDALVNAALVSLDNDDAVAARAFIDRALAVAPDYPEAHALLAQLLLRKGQYADGWREYEWRFHCSDARYRLDSLLPQWDGAGGATCDVRIYAEQGLGDQIMFASCLPEVIARARHCDIECDSRLVKLFARSFPAARIRAQQPDLAREWSTLAPPAESRQIHIGSLPQLFRGAPEQFPQHAGYLRADPARIAYWSDQLNTLGDGLKIGIAWRGGVPRTRQALRSIPLQQWMPLLQIPQTHFVSLQHGECAGDYNELAAHNVAVAHWQGAIDDFDEMAALVAALDLVVTVCGSVVHLAGALGKSVRVLVPSCPEWRYSGASDTMPWYPTVRLFRQKLAGEWQRPIGDLAQEISTAAELFRRGHNI